MTFTKEQLTRIIETDHVQCGDASALARMALAGMETEPVISVIFKDGWAIVETVGVVAGSEKLPDGVHEFYTAPQPLTTSERAELENYRNAQQVVPSDGAIFEAAIDVCRESDSIDEHAWNHGVLAVMSAFSNCRAAMLQGKAEPVSLAKTETVKHWYMVSWIAQGGRHGSTEVWFDHPWMKGDMLDVTKSIAELNNVTGLVIVSAFPIAAAPQQEAQ